MGKKMRIMGIDQSFTSTGICILEDFEDGLRCIYSDVYKTTTEHDKFWRCYQISTHLAELAEEWNPDQINIEGLSFGARGDATRDLGGLLYAIVILLHTEMHYELEIIPPSTLKKYGAGYGFAKKENMIMAVPERLRETWEDRGFKKTTGLSDLADAYFLADIYWREYH